MPSRDDVYLSGFLSELLWGDLFACPRPLSSMCHSSFVIEEVPASHTTSRRAVCYSCFVEWRAASSSVFLLFPGKGKVVVWRGMRLEKSARIHDPAISILSQSLRFSSCGKIMYFLEQLTAVCFVTLRFPHFVSSILPIQ